MPPRKAEKQLTTAERDLLTRWVKEGGKYAKHWAFVPPKKLRPDWTGNAIDALVGRRLKAEGIAFAPEADKATLARRVALVLTGLPPELPLQRSPWRLWPEGGSAARWPDPPQIRWLY